jgi:preprotein translocase subunit YajC
MGMEARSPEGNPLSRNIFLAKPTTAPGREGAAPAPAAPPPAAPGQPSQGAPGDGAAPPPPSSPFGGTTILLFLLPLLLIFMMTRNQTKKQKQLEQTLKKGDTVVTQSGLIGKIIELGERTVKLEISPGVNVKMLKSTIQGVDPGDAKPAADAKVDASTSDKDKGDKDKNPPPSDKKA